MALVRGFTLSVLQYVTVYCKVLSAHANQLPLGKIVKHFWS